MGMVLLVEDNPDVRDMMSLALELAGHRVIAAANGMEALDLLRTERPCVILLDLMMPVMDGWQFRDQLEQSRACRGVPLIVISALTEVVKRLPGVEHLSKPVDIDRMLELVDQYCRAEMGVESEGATESDRSGVLRP
jgi:CheY-like chemotaxis protein